MSGISEEKFWNSAQYKAMKQWTHHFAFTLKWKWRGSDSVNVVAMTVISPHPSLICVSVWCGGIKNKKWSKWSGGDWHAVWPSCCCSLSQDVEEDMVNSVHRLTVNTLPPPPPPRHWLLLFIKCLLILNVSQVKSHGTLHCISLGH